MIPRLIARGSRHGRRGGLYRKRRSSHAHARGLEVRRLLPRAKGKCASRYHHAIMPSHPFHKGPAAASAGTRITIAAASAEGRVRGHDDRDDDRKDAKRGGEDLNHQDLHEQSGVLGVGQRTAATADADAHPARRGRAPAQWARERRSSRGRSWLPARGSIGRRCWRGRGGTHPHARLPTPQHMPAQNRA